MRSNYKRILIYFIYLIIFKKYYFNPSIFFNKFLLINFFFQFRNIHECYKYNNCTSISSGKQYVEGAVLMIGHGKGNGGCYFTNTKFDQMYGGKKNEMVIFFFK